MLMRVITALIAIAAGVLVLLGYFIQAFNPIQVLLLNWAIVIAGGAAIVGIFNLITVHTDKIRRREKGSVYSALLVASLVAAFFFGIALRPEHEWMHIILNGIIIPVETMLMGLLTITLLYAAIRLLRRRTDAMGIAFLVTAFIVILGYATLAFGDVPLIGLFPLVSGWVTHVWALGGARGILIGVALGALTTGLRVLFGADRPYGGN